MHLRAQRIRLARPAKWRLHFLMALQQRLIRPLRSERFILIDLIEPIKNLPGCVRANCNDLLDILNWFMHNQVNRKIR